MPTPIVIDLSHHNIVHDLGKAKATGIIGVIHKATEGQTVKDNKVDAREHMAREAGLLFGLYHFIRASNVEAQVDNFMNVYNRYDATNLLIALDYEDEDVSLAMCEEWLADVEQRTGKRVVIYSGHVLKGKLGNNPHKFINGSNYALWLAQYAIRPKLPPGWDDYWLWQYTEKGECPGVRPPVDLNDGEPDRVVEFWTGGKPPEVTTKEDEFRKALEDIRRRADEALGG